MFHLLAILFAVPAAALGSPRFADRERAERVLYRAYPLSLPALVACRESPDPEVRHREAVVRRAVRSVPGWAGLAVLLDPDDGEAVAVRMILAREEGYYGLPFASAETHSRGQSPRLCREVCRANRKLGVVTGGVLACDPDLNSAWWVPDVWPTAPSVAGLDDVRFRVRGLPGPTHPATFYAAVGDFWRAKKAFAAAYRLPLVK